MIDEVLFLRHGRTAYTPPDGCKDKSTFPSTSSTVAGGPKAGTNRQKPAHWAKVAHLAEHNDQLAQPAYGNAHLADVDEINNARRGPPHARRLVGSVPRAAPTLADLMGLDVELDPRLRERSFGEWEGMTREEICEHYADDYHSWRAHTGGETNYGVESRIHTGRRGAEAVRDIVAKHHDETMPTTLLLVGHAAHGSWPPWRCCSTWTPTISTTSARCATPSGRA